MCNLVDLSAAAECATSDGGIFETWIVDGTQITDVVFDVNGQITNFVMATTGQWQLYEYDDDDSASYNQNGERANKKITVTQASFFKFAGVTATKIEFANGIKDCCKLVLIHRFNSGVALVQGVEQYNASWRFTKQKAKATPNVLSDTGAGEDRIEINANSVGAEYSANCTLTNTEIAAL